MFVHCLCMSVHFWKHVQELRTWFASGESNCLAQKLDKEEEFYLKIFYMCGLFRNVGALNI
jgi:hypothetical protein